MQLRAQADPVINRDPEGNPLSVVVHLYQLKDRVGFDRLGFDAAASGRPEAELLGADCLGRTELVVVPGGSHTAALDLLPGTRFVGIVALFRRPDPQGWRYLVSLDRIPAGRNRGRRKPGEGGPVLAFRVRECSLDLPGLQPESLPGQPESRISGEAGPTRPGGARP
jgi:type VI secretion system protein VasD